MTVYSQPVIDIAGAGDHSRFWFYREDNLSPSEDESVIITGGWVGVLPVAGVLTTPSLKPGPAKVSWGGKEYDLVIRDHPDNDPIPLWPDIQNYIAPPAPVVNAAQTAATRAESAASDAADALALIGSGTLVLTEDPPGSGLFSWVNILDGQLARASSVYRSAARAAGTSRLKLLTIGDSTNDGYGKPGGPDAWAKTWPLKLAELLRANLGVSAGGRGWVGPSTPLAPGSYVWSPSTLAPAGFALDDLTTQIGIPGSLWLQRGHASNVDEVTWTLSAGVTAVDVITTGYGGNLVITPATGSPVTIDSTGDRKITRVTNPGATINVHGAAGVGIAVLGIIEHIGDATAGVTQWNLSRGAMAAHEYAAWLADGAKSLKPIIGTYAPHVALVCLGANDYATGRTPSQLGTALTAIHTHIKAVSPATEVVVLIRPLADDPAQATTWTTYVGTIVSTAATLGARVLDVRSTLTGPGLYIADGVHLTEAGNAALAGLVRDYMKVGV
ncbi:SGNH/GDSL hydrolase family protein [Rhodococcus koreensis]|uniref:SGNH/GDSL hydrolase family protein n=1 Tax=Rhodococcus koreensis TaxID=99653 RepID=UPI003672DC13